MNKDKQIICDYCKNPSKEQTDCMPTWFGRYCGEELLEVICSDCLPKNREKWSKYGKKKI